MHLTPIGRILEITAKIGWYTLHTNHHTKLHINHTSPGLESVISGYQQNVTGQLCKFWPFRFYLGFEFHFYKTQVNPQKHRMLKIALSKIFRFK